MRTLLFFLCLVFIVCWAAYARMVLSEQAYDAQRTGVRWPSYNKTDKEFLGKRIIKYLSLAQLFPHANLANHAKMHCFTRVCHPDGRIRAIAMYDSARFARFA